MSDSTHFPSSNDDIIIDGSSENYNRNRNNDFDNNINLDPLSSEYNREFIESMPEILKNLSDMQCKIDSVLLDCWFEYEYYVNTKRWVESFEKKLGIATNSIQGRLNDSFAKDTENTVLLKFGEGTMIMDEVKEKLKSFESELKYISDAIQECTSSLRCGLRQLQPAHDRFRQYKLYDVVNSINKSNKVLNFLDGIANSKEDMSSSSHSRTPVTSIKKRLTRNQRNNLDGFIENDTDDNDDFDNDEYDDHNDKNDGDDGEDEDYEDFSGKKKKSRSSTNEKSSSIGKGSGNSTGKGKGNRGEKKSNDKSVKGQLPISSYTTNTSKNESNWIPNHRQDFIRNDRDNIHNSNHSSNHNSNTSNSSSNSISNNSNHNNSNNDNDNEEEEFDLNESRIFSFPHQSHESDEIPSALPSDKMRSIDNRINNMERNSQNNEDNDFEFHSSDTSERTKSTISREITNKSYKSEFKFDLLETGSSTQGNKKRKAPLNSGWNEMDVNHQFSDRSTNSKLRHNSEVIDMTE